MMEITNMGDIAGTAWTVAPFERGTCSLAEVLAVQYGHQQLPAYSGRSITDLTADEIIHITCDE
jgi:hypothetical protein